MLVTLVGSHVYLLSVSVYANAAQLTSCVCMRAIHKFIFSLWLPTRISLSVKRATSPNQRKTVKVYNEKKTA